MIVNGDLCINCKTGMDSLKLDPNSPQCPYLGMYVEGICGAYVAIDSKKQSESLKEMKK